MAQTFGPVYDTHAAVRRLTEAGIPEPQAEAVVREQTHILEHNLATKADIETLRQETRAEIAAVRADVEKLRLETRADIETLRQETRASIETLRQETEAEIAAVRADVEKLRLETKADIETLRQETKAGIEVAKTELIKWVVGTNLGVVAIVIAALKLL